MTTVQFQSVSPIGSTDPLNLPVADAQKAIEFYTTSMGFTQPYTDNLETQPVRLVRDSVTLGFAENGGDPEQASCYLAVSDVGNLQAEYEDKGVNVTQVSEMEHEGKQYRVFWAKDPGGICYCIGTPA